MRRISDRIINGLATLLGMGLIAMVLLSVYNVVSRYIFSDALLWADEIAVFAMIVITWLGAIVCAWRKIDIRMEILTAILPRRLRFALAIVQQTVIAGLCTWVAWLSYGYVARVFKFNMTSDSAGIPIWFVHGAITFGLAAIAMIAALRIVWLIRAGSSRFESTSDARDVEA